MEINERDDGLAIKSLFNSHQIRVILKAYIQNNTSPEKQQFTLPNHDMQNVGADLFDAPIWDECIKSVCHVSDEEKDASNASW